MLAKLYTMLQAFSVRFKEDERGVTALEYGLIAALIAVVIIGAVGAVGDGLAATFDRIAEELPL